MAFSLEAAMVVPLAMSALLGLLRTALPVYSDVSLAARLEMTALADAISPDSLYGVRTIRIGQRQGMSLCTSPQSVIELAELLRDDTRLIAGAVSGLSEGAEKAGAKP